MPATIATAEPQGPAITALVTGASRGIGLALVQALLSDSATAHVFATSRNAGTEPTLQGLVSGSAQRLTTLNLDVHDEASIAAAASAVRDTGSRVELIINCIGVLHDGGDLQPEKRLAQVTVHNLAHSFAINAVGPLLIAKHFQDLLPSDARAVVANLSARVGSISDNRLGGWYSYRMSKAAQNMMTKNLSIELRRRARGVICVALHPGTVDTGLSRPFQGKVPAEQLFSVERAARQLLGVINGLEAADNGGFFAWDARPIPW